MSGGRVELGLGAGWNDREHAAYGIPFPATGERFDRLEEQLAIITGLWSTPVGEHFSYAGTHYSVDDSPRCPKPVQQPHPPIVMGGFGAKRTPRLAARYADEFNVAFAPPDAYPEIVGRVARRVRGHRPRSGVAADEHRRTPCCAAPTRPRSRARAAAIGRDVDDRPARALRGDARRGRSTASAQYATTARPTVYFQVLDLHDLDHLRLLAAEVAARLR